MWGILILADFRPMGYKLSCYAMAVFGLGKNLLFKSFLGRCEFNCDFTKSLTLLCTGFVNRQY